MNMGSLVQKFPAIFISIQMTGNPIPQIGFGGVNENGVYLLDKLDGLHKELGFAEYTSGSKSTLDITPSSR